MSTLYIIGGMFAVFLLVAGYGLLLDWLNALPIPNRPDRILCWLRVHPQDRSTLVKSERRTFHTGMHYYYRCNLCGRDWETKTGGRMWSQ